ncbi:hypothetical protein HYT23_06590 [Candidatus Pacearchaeota archaeon]|nr:hypothetical protein [Candidatus Pacearchaeota archaeon]
MKNKKTKLAPERKFKELIKRFEKYFLAWFIILLILVAINLIIKGVDIIFSLLAFWAILGIILIYPYIVLRGFLALKYGVMIMRFNPQGIEGKVIVRIIGLFIILISTYVIVQLIKLAIFWI